MKTLLSILFFASLFLSCYWFAHSPRTIVINPLTSLDLISKHARFYGVSEKLLKDLAMIESSMCQNVVSKVSSARGCFQFVSETWERYCVGEVMSENDNIRCAAKMIGRGMIGQWTADKITKERLLAMGYHF